MKFNPFVPGGVVSPGMFSGRVAELDTIEKALFQTSHGSPRHFIIEGERGIGKTSLLFFVQILASGNITYTLKDAFRFLTISVELKASHTFEDIVRLLALELKEQLGVADDTKTRFVKAWEFLRKWEVMGVRYHDERGNPADPVEELNNFVSALIEVLSSAEYENQGIAILIDEADRPSEAARLGEILKLMTERLTKRHSDRVLVGLAGLPGLLQKLGAGHESAPRLFEVLSLEPLSKADSRTVVQRGIEQANKRNEQRTEITENALDEIADLSEGYPHFIQQFSYSAFESDDDDVIDREDVLRGAYGELGALEQLGQKFFSRMYFELINSNDYRLVLDAMAIHGDQLVQRAQIIEETGLSEHTVGNALKALVDREVIVRNEHGRGQYKVPTKSFAAWINARRTVISESIEGRDAELPFSQE